MRRLGFLLATTLLLLSCRNPLREIDPDLSIVRIRPTLPGSDGGRTVVADFSTQFDTLTVSLASDEGYLAPEDQTVSKDIEQVTFTVPGGTWNITVVAKRGTVEVGRGVKNDVVLGGGLTAAVNVPIVFGSAGSNGSIHFTVTVPETTGVDYVQGKIEDTNTICDPQSPSLSGGVRSWTFVIPSLPEKTYSFTLTFKRGGVTGTEAGIFREKIVVVGGYDSASWVNDSGSLVGERAFAETEFLGGNASLSALTFDSGVLSFTFDSFPTQPFDLGDRAGVPSSITFTPIGSIPDQYIRYRWNGSSTPVEIRSGDPSAPLAVSFSGVNNELVLLVTAPDRVTEKEYSVKFVAVPPEVSGLAATASPNSVTLTWTNPTVGYFSEVQITYCEEGSGGVLDTITLQPLSPGASGSHTIAGLSSLQPYVFTVRTGASTSHYSPGTSYWACPGGPAQTDFAVDASGTITNYSGSATDVIIPASVGGVATKAIAQQLFYNNGTPVSIVVPDSVEIVGDYAFLFCGNLKSIVFGSSVTHLGRYLTGPNNYSLRTLTFKNPMPPPTVGEYVFNQGENYLSNIYVPTESLQSYKDAPGLQGYASKMVGK
jgi:hypothetical protein